MLTSRIWHKCVQQFRRYGLGHAWRYIYWTVRGSQNRLVTVAVSILCVHPPDRRTISLVLTHYNRPDLIVASLRYAIFDGRIGEIVVYDDCSASESYLRLEKRLSRMSKKIKIVRGKKNLGPLRAKIAAISHAENDRAILLDSDNVLSSHYVDRLYRIENWDRLAIYCPARAKPNFKFDKFCGVNLTNEVARRFAREESGFLELFNDGNYFVSVSDYERTALRVPERNVFAADVATFNAAWLQGGGHLVVVHGLAYYHRVHSESYWISRSTESWQIVTKLIFDMSQ